MKKILEKLKVIFTADKFIVTGSYALSLYGIKQIGEVNDLDIILINPSINTRETINRFMEEFPAKTKPKTPLVIPSAEKINFIKPSSKERMTDSCQVSAGSSYLSACAIFMYDSIKIDIYICNHFHEPTLIIEDMEFATIPHIIAAKKRYGRMKDWLQCRDMGRMFFKPEEFEKLLNGDWKTTLRVDY